MKKLDILLASLFVLRQNVHARHFNVTGTHFRTLHLIYDDIYKLINDWYDKLGEMIRQLNEYPIYNIPDMLDISIYESDRMIYNDMVGANLTSQEMERICTLINDMVKSGEFDEITNNDLAQMGSDLRQQYYFIGSFVGSTIPKY